MGLTFFGKGTLFDKLEPSGANFARKPLKPIMTPIFRCFSLLALVLLPVYANAQSGKNPLLKISVQGAPDGQMVYIYQPTEFQPRKVDSAKVTGGTAVFSRRPNFVRGLYLVGPALNQTFQGVLGEPGIVATVAHPEWNAAQPTGGKENALYKEYQAIANRGNAAIERIQTDFNKEAKAGFANPIEQQNQYAAARRRTDSVYQAQDRAFKALAKNNPGTFMGKAAAYLAANENDQPDTYLKDKDFMDPELAQGDWVRSKISLWLQRFIPLDLEQWQRAARQAIEKAPKGSEGRNRANAAIVSIFYPIDQDFTKLVVRDWVKEFPNSAEARMVQAAFPPASPEVGEMAPDIVLKDSSGKELPLSSLRGKYVMVDFWASWCGPCRMENPTVVKAYNKFKDKGFTIYSVSLDNDRGRWLQAIKKDNLSWPNHVSDLKGWGSAGAKIYRVSSIPATFMVDPSGKIVAMNLRGEKLEQFLSNALGSKP